MIDLEVFTYMILILMLSIIHTSGEALYKKGAMLFVAKNAPLKDMVSYLKDQFTPLLVIGVSIGISFIVKAIYGILLVTNPLSVSSGLFLGFIAIFSVIFGKFCFGEHISRPQWLGIVLIALGITLLV